jgi:glycogen debranching enzyme
VYGAYRARAALARDLGDAVLAVNCDERADELARRFDEVFWLPDVEWYAVALDADKRPVRSLTSNLGHLLWTGIVSPERARRLASVLGSPQMFTGFGLRTLASDHAGYNPLSYHCGSVWPHDTAIAVAGLARYGFDAEATTLANGLLGAARAGDGRLPELFGGFARDDIGSPVPYPSSCSPQAWAAGAPLLVLRSLLGLDPDVPNGRLDLRPRLPASMGRVRMHGIPIGGHSIDLVASGREATVTGTDLTIAVH